MKLMTVAFLLMFTVIAPSIIDKTVLAQADSPAGDAKDIKAPDISGDWMSDSPLAAFVSDRASQPVNRFAIEKLDDGGFQARYIGELAAGVKLRWIPDKRHFSGTIKRGDDDDTTFVVIPGPDADILTVKSTAKNCSSRTAHFTSTNGGGARSRSLVTSLKRDKPRLCCTRTAPI